MEPKTIRIIAALPPKGSKAAMHAGEVIFHLGQAGHLVRPATAAKPAYSPDILRFAPKRNFEPMKTRLLDEGADALVLYPEGLGFGLINQKRWRHRRLEEWRRLTLVWQLLRHSKRSIVVFRPTQLWRLDHFSIALAAGVLKLRHPKRISLFRQSLPPKAVVEPILGTRPAPCSLDEADLASAMLAAKHGASGVMRLTSVWLLSALKRLDPKSPLYDEISNIEAIVNAFGVTSLPAFQAPAGRAVSAPFQDKVENLTHGVPLSRFMLHLRHARRLDQRFPLDSPKACTNFRNWYIQQAPGILGHALPLPAPPDTPITGFSPAELATLLHHIETYSRFFGAAQSIEPASRAWLNTKLVESPAGLTRLELLIAIIAHAPIQSPQTLQTPWQDAGLKSWFARLANSGYPLLAELGGIAPPQSPPALLVTGNAQDDTGIGQNQKMSIEALADTMPKRDVFLHHANADAIPSQMLKHNKPGAFHIGYLLWELEKIPEAHRLAGELLDEIWVPTRYLQEIYQREYDRPVTCIGKGFDLPAPQDFDLAQLGITPGQPVFLVSFDLHSSVARKNPLAAVLAFQMAFNDRPDVRLVIKTSLPPKNHWGDPEKQMSIIQKIIAKDSRIILFQAHLPFASYLGLIRAATALVSPHRAEGFGYVPAYAMKLGTPVIVTDYSGTQDFCTKNTALCVPWRPRNVRPGEPIFPVEGATWAEVNHEALAQAMHDILADPTAAEARSKAAGTLMRREYTAAALRSRYLARLHALDLA